LTSEALTLTSEALTLTFGALTGTFSALTCGFLTTWQVFVGNYCRLWIGADEVEAKVVASEWESIPLTWIPA
jgi:hypothetical protein